MLYEIDLLPVGEGEKSGDAICLRYSNDGGSSWTVGVVDGGTQDSGNSLCSHIEAYYKTKEVDFVICTHPDQDHASGLSCVLEDMTVKKVLMHCPWDYVDYIFDRVSDGRVTKESLKARLIEGHPYAYKVCELALENNVPIYHAFSDVQDHGVPHLTVAGPSSGFYFDQLVNFRSITEITEDERDDDLLRAFMDTAKKAIKWLTEKWDDEKLVDPEDDATSAENNSSTVLLFNFDGKKKLLTADAGVPALESAANFIESQGIPLRDFSFFQTPHHGSKRNIGPTVLNRLIGEPGPDNMEPFFTACVSATKMENSKHPCKRVVNAFIRRGAKVVTTQGSKLYLFTPGTPDRGWADATPLPFYNEVEEDDD